MAISDLVLLHNKATDAQAKKDPIGIDLFDKIPDVKREFLKFRKPFEARLSSNVETHHVIAKDEEHTTDIMIPGFIFDKSARGSKRLGALKTNLQFLEHHKVQFLALHHELAKIGYSPQTDATLTNFKTIIELELGLLMGGNIDWAGASDVADPAAAAEAGPVLPAAAANDDDDSSSNENNGDGAAATGPADNASPPATSAASSAASAASSAGPPSAPAASAVAPAGGGGAGGAGEDDAPDPNDFTTWTPENWAGLDFNCLHSQLIPSLASVLSGHTMR